MYCKHCGYENDKDASFCQKCGSNLSFSKSQKPPKHSMTNINKILIVAIVVLIGGVGISAGALFTTTNEFTTSPTPTDDGLSDKAIELVQNYEDSNGFTIADNVRGITNMLDTASSTTHEADWSASKIDNTTYEVTMTITPDEWDGSGGGTAKWNVNVETGEITPLDENAKVLMNIISDNAASGETTSTDGNTGSNGGYTIEYYMPYSKSNDYLDPDLFKKREPMKVENIHDYTRDKPEEYTSDTVYDIVDGTVYVYE